MEKAGRVRYISFSMKEAFRAVCVRAVAVTAAVYRGGEERERKMLERATGSREANVCMRRTCVCV